MDKKERQKLGAEIYSETCASASRKRANHDVVLAMAIPPIAPSSSQSYSVHEFMTGRPRV
jgi:hypothetical protein